MDPSDPSNDTPRRSKGVPWYVGTVVLVGAVLIAAAVLRADIFGQEAASDTPPVIDSSAVQADDAAEPAPSIAVAPGSDRSDTAEPGVVRFAVAGDVGTGGAEEIATADAMYRLEGDDEYAALLLLGDNVYEDGDPSELGARVFEPFAEVLDGGTQLLAVLGNHDVDSGFGDAQAAGLGMPAAWYATRFDDVVVIALDSNRPDDPNQLDFLENTLASATETWKIVMFHHPPYSGGWHGSDMTVRDAFVPLFEEHGVQLVMTGHDHDYQRSEDINGVTYVVSGGAALLRDTALADFSVVAESTYHFVDLKVSADRLALRAVGQDGGEIDSVTLIP